MGLSSDERQRMGKAGKNYNVREFGFQQLVDRLECLIKEAVR